MGFGACPNARAAGREPKNSPAAFGSPSFEGDPASDCKGSRKSLPVRVGKKGVECAIMYVCTCSARLIRIAIPQGLALGPVSEICVIPVELEKRIVRGVACRIGSTSQ